MGVVKSIGCVVVWGTLMVAVVSRAGIIIDSLVLPEADDAVWAVGRDDERHYGIGWLPLDEPLGPLADSGVAVVAARDLAARGLALLVPWSWSGEETGALSYLDRILLEWVLEEEQTSAVYPERILLDERMLQTPERLRLPDAPLDWDE